ncbi:MAG TPA: glycosyltransferase family 2 protein [Candidatus Dormibacteraeota bacterium]|nr:glycosyltransferase family 2 protein [Candidatus Dormibacteraeota bacterium]
MADAAPSISIVIPTLNAGRAFGTVLHRIMGQGRQPLEILCADSGSTDATKHIVSQFALARFVQIGEPFGPRTWNAAMQEAKGDVVVFLGQDAVPANGDWLNHLTAPFDDPSVAGVYGRQEAAMESDPLSGFRLGQRFCREPHWRRLRIGDRVPYKGLPFFIENAAVRRSIWRGIRFNEHLPIGADRVWARQVILASCTIGYAPDALVVRPLRASLNTMYRLALLTGYTDKHYGDNGGTLWPDSRHFVKRAAWYLVKGLAWGQLPYLAVEDFVQRYGYKLGQRLDRLGPMLRERVAPNVAKPAATSDIDDLAA